MSDVRHSSRPDQLRRQGIVPADPTFPYFRLHFAAPRTVCPVCGTPDQPIHDRLSPSWQYLHFFPHRAFLHADMPRVACQCGKATQLPVGVQPQQLCQRLNRMVDAAYRRG